MSGRLQAEEMGFRRRFSKHYTYSNIQLNKTCALWKYTEQWASSRSHGFQRNFFETLYTFKTYNWTKYALCENTLSGGPQAEAMGFRRSFSKHYKHSNIQLNNVCALWKHTEWLALSRSNGSQKKFFEPLYTCKHTNEQSMRSVKVHWEVGFKQKQYLAEEIFQNIIHIQAYNWTKYALCESTLSGGLQAGAMGFRRNFSKHFTQSNIQLNNVCAPWKYTGWLASSRSNGSQKKVFKTFDTFKQTIEQSMRSVKVHWLVGFKQKQWLAEEVFQNNIHIQAYTWTKYAFCESTLSGGLQSEVTARRRSFLKHYTPSNIHLNKVCLLRNFSEWSASSRRNGFQKTFFKTLYILKHTIEQCMRSVKVHWVVGFKQEQWVSEEIFQNILHSQTFNWIMYALRESKLGGWLQAEAMARRRRFSKHLTHSNKQLNKVCAL